MERADEFLNYGQIGLAQSTRFVDLVHIIYGTTIYYRVAAVLKQSNQYGVVNQTGSWTYSSVYIGDFPAWTYLTPTNNSRFVARVDHPISIPLQVFVRDIDIVTIQFSSLESFPSVAGLFPTLPIVNFSSNLVTQYLTMNFSADLAGSEFLMCIFGEDTSGFRTEVRYFYLLLPKPEPRLVLPGNNSIFTARLGCDLTVLISAEDRTSAGLDPNTAGMNGFFTGVELISVTTFSRYKSDTSAQLPAGAFLRKQNLSLTFQNPSTSIFLWRPVKGQEGLSHR